MAAFIPVERALAIFLRVTDKWPDSKRRITATMVLREAKDVGLVKTFEDLIFELSRLRNAAVHEFGPQITTETAVQYIDAAAGVRTELAHLAATHNGGGSRG